MTRSRLEQRVDELDAQHSGKAFANAMREFHDSLPEDDRETLRAIVLERAANFDQAVIDRVDARGWLRRQWDKASGR